MVMPPDPFPDSVTRPVIPLLVIDSLPENPESAATETGDNKQVRFSAVFVDYGFYVLNFQS
jgi:hypothetical protein